MGVDGCSAARRLPDKRPVGGVAARGAIGSRPGAVVVALRRSEPRKVPTRSDPKAEQKKRAAAASGTAGAPGAAGVGAGAAAPGAGADGAKAAEAPKRERAPARGWRDTWQLPALLLGGVLLVAGLMTARSSRPPQDFDGALNDVGVLLSRQEFRAALDVLNNTLLPHIGDPEATREHVQRFHLLRGDAIFQGLTAEGLSNPDNYKAVLQEYDIAEKADPDALDASRQAVYAECLIALGRDEAALKRIHELAPTEGARRRQLLKRLIERNLAAREVKSDPTLALLTELIEDPGLENADRQWAVAREAEMRLDAGYTEEALSHLLRAMQRFGDLTGRPGGELYLLLARCYFELGRMDDAERQLDRATALLPDSDALVGEVTALSARIALAQRRLEDARDRFSQVVSEYPGGKSADLSMLGLGEVEAALSDFPASLRAYAQVVGDSSHAALASPEKARHALPPERIAASLLRQFRERFEREDYANALNFAQLGENLYAADKVPAEVLLAIAQSHRALADHMLADAKRADGEPVDLSELDPVTRAEARAHYADAGAYYLRHARASVLLDDAASGDSLWRAGDSYDKAGELEKAIGVFSEFASGRPDDSRQPAAAFRLAQAHMARGDYAVASQFFSDLVARLPKSGEGARSYVPLAQCYLLDDKPDNDGEAERLLTTVIGGRLIAPDALEFRDALVTLARMRLRAGRYDEAIEKLTEAVQRFPQDREIDRLRYDLAEANRLSAGEIEETLREAMPEDTRRALTQERQRRLAAAQGLYDEVRAALEARDARRTTTLERLQMRNSMFYRADCAFDLGDYDAAIKLYDAAAQRYVDDPASLVAMIQIVNAYVAKGAWREAQTANERARQRLGELPDNVFNSPDLPLDRRHMERWLESSAKINARADAGPSHGT